MLPRGARHQARASVEGVEASNVHERRAKLFPTRLRGRAARRGRGVQARV